MSINEREQRGKPWANLVEGVPPHQGAPFAPHARQLQLEHLTEGFLRVLNREDKQKICAEESHIPENFVLVCRTDPAY